MKVALNIEDLREMARKRLPRIVFDYIDGGAEGEITLRENVAAFDRLIFRPRGAVLPDRCDVRTTVLGHELAFPLMLGPVGSSRMFHRGGEVAAARAAGTAGIGYILSTLSGSRMEDVRAATTGPAWFQLYLVGGHDVARAGIARARKAGFTALVVTTDTAIAGLRERDFRNGTKELLSRRPLAMLPHVGQVLSRPGWLLDFIRDRGLMNFPNVILPDGPMAYADVGAALEKSAVCWDDLRWIREAWQGPIVIKGVHTAEDARRAVDAGAQAVVVSNHGGRQLDGVAATLDILPEVVDAVGTEIEVLMDGGVRRGSDIAKALCLGARAVLIGRGYAYGLAAGGEAGVANAIDIFRSGFVRTMKLLGCPSLAELDESFVASRFEPRVPSPEPRATAL